MKNEGIVTKKRGVTWMHLVACALATGVSTVLAIWAVIAAPIPPAPGVSGLYIAAAVYVPLALWLGIWGCIAGYLSCVFMGLFVGYPLPFVLVWSLADFFEGFVPLVAFRTFKVDPELKIKKPRVAYSLLGLLIIDLIISGVAAMLALSEIFIATFIIAVILMLITSAIERSRSWIFWIVFGVIAASIVSGLFGAGTLAWWFLGWGAFPIVLFGWTFGDIIILSTIGTTLMIVLTPFIKRTFVYVRGYFS